MYLFWAEEDSHCAVETSFVSYISVSLSNYANEAIETRPASISSVADYTEV